MALIIGTATVLGVSFGGYFLYRKKNEIVYQLLKMYTNMTEKSNLLIKNDNNTSLNFDYHTFNCETAELELCNVNANCKDGLDLEDDFTLSKIENESISYYSFTKHFNLLEVYNDYYDNKNKTNYVSLLNKMVNTNNSILAASATIHINNRLYQKEIDITFLIKYFVYPGSVIYLIDEYKYLILYFINKHYNMNLNIKDLIDNEVALDIYYCIISFDGDIHKSYKIVITMDENGLSNIYKDLNIHIEDNP